MHCFSRCESQPRRQNQKCGAEFGIYRNRPCRRNLALRFLSEKETRGACRAFNQVLICYVSQLGVNKGFTLYTEQCETVRPIHETRECFNVTGRVLTL